MISVLDAPLFTAVDIKGEVVHMGLMPLLTQAHELKHLKAGSCTGRLALIRLCIAFLSDAYRLVSMDDRAELLDRGRFDADLLNDYVARQEAAGACFALDAPVRPFMQAAYDPELDDKALKPVSKIMFDVPSGNNHIFNDHRHEDQHEATTAQAFELLLETYMFCPAGLSGASNVNNTPPVYALINGGNLFETLALNMVSQRELGNIPFGAGETAWERRETVIPKKETVDMSFLKALTWQPRRASLIWDEDGMVRRLHLQNGLNFQGNGLWQDPNVIYRRTKDDAWSSIKPELGRELWRDAGSLIAKGGRTRSTVPIQNVQSVWLDCPDNLDIELIGLVTNQESILGRVEERLIMPKQLLDDPDAAYEFCQALESVETMHSSLKNAVVSQFTHQSDRNKKSAVADAAGEVYLHAMRDVLFGRYLVALTAGEGDRAERFMDDLWLVLNDTIQRVVETTGDDVSSMKRQGKVRSRVRNDYLKLRERGSDPNE